MKIRVCCPGEKLVDVPNDSKEPLADACRLTNYKYHYAIDDYTKTFTLCPCIKCIDGCREIKDKVRRVLLAMPMRPMREPIHRKLLNTCSASYCG